MDYEQAAATLRRIVLIGCRKCVLIGGEPTLHPRIVDIYADGKRLGLTMRLVTNGRLFSNENFCQEMVNAGLETGEITLSMHASSNADSVVLTGKRRHFDQFKRGFDNLTELGVNPFINITICRPLSDKIEDMVRWLALRRAQSVSFNLGAPAISQQGVDGSFTLTPRELATKVKELFELGKSLDIKMGFLFTVPFCLLPREDIQGLLEAGVIVSGCQVISGSGILFNVEGQLVACNHLLDFPIVTREEIEVIIDGRRFAQFWESDMMQGIRNTACVYRSEYCEMCDLWDACGGGCPIFWFCYDSKQYITGWREKGGAE